MHSSPQQSYPSTGNDAGGRDDYEEEEEEEDMELLDLVFDDLWDHEEDTNDEGEHGSSSCQQQQDDLHYQNQHSNCSSDSRCSSSKFYQNKNFKADCPSEQYILGTLIVRVLAARDLKAPRRGHVLNSHITRRRIFQRAPSFTFASVSFGGNDSLRTSSVEDTQNPTWTRSEHPLLFDVSVPVSRLCHEDVRDDVRIAVDSDLTLGNRHCKNVCAEQVPTSFVMVSLFHSEHGNSSVMAIKKKRQEEQAKQKAIHQDQDELIGVSYVDVTTVITGKVSCIDKWVSLGGVDDASGSVRVIIEYDCAESPPRVGDKVRLNGFVDPTFCPLPKSQIFQVDNILADEVILSYVTPMEHWKCTFQAHRFMLISVERHVSALERYQDELLNLTYKLAHSPAADVVSETMNRLPEEGLLFVGMQAAFGSLSLLERWKTIGLSATLEDVVYATNLDGQHTPHELDRDDDDEDENDPSWNEKYDNEELLSSNDDISSLDSDASAESLESGMPCCPITGQPMRRPVVAADGNTYERSAIRRWLRSSDMSPLTGTKLKHKDLIPNYLLISSFQSWKKSEDENYQISQI